MADQTAGAHPRAARRVLVVDDEPHVRLTVGQMLRVAAGFDVVEASNGAAALARYKEATPAIVVMDVRMPGMDGFDATRCMLQVDPATPIILMTGFADDSSEAAALAAGAVELIRKPFTWQRLATAVQDALGSGQLERQNHRLNRQVALLTEKDRALEERLRQAQEKPDDTPSTAHLDRHRMLCGATAHGLRAEYVHIGASVRSIRELCPQSPDVQEECDVIERSMQYSQLALGRLLEHLELGRPARSAVDLGDVLARAEALVRPRLPSNIALCLSVEAGCEHATLLGDHEQLLGVVIELIENARDVLRVTSGTITVGVEGRPGKVELSVTDDGPGIPQEIRERLMNEQVPSKRGGMGMGLLFCKSVIGGMGGEICLESAEGAGTTVTLSLPLAPAGEEASDAGTDSGRGGQPGDPAALRPGAEAPPHPQGPGRRSGSRR